MSSDSGSNTIRCGHAVTCDPAVKRVPFEVAFAVTPLGWTRSAKLGSAVTEERALSSRLVSRYWQVAQSSLTAPNSDTKVRASSLRVRWFMSSTQQDCSESVNRVANLRTESHVLSDRGEKDNLQLPLDTSFSASSSDPGSALHGELPRSPRLARLVPLEVQLFLLALLPSGVRSRSQYARRVSQRVARLRYILRQRKWNRAGTRTSESDNPFESNQMQISVSLHPRSPRSGATTPDDLAVMPSSREQLERIWERASPMQQSVERPNPEHHEVNDSGSVWEMGERALSFLLQTRRRRLLMYALLLTMILAPARAEGLARWAGELGIRPLAIRHPIFAVLSVLLDMYQELVGSNLIPDDSHWSLIAHVVEVVLLMVAM